jgi:uncharacterized protein (TIGR02266 family)
MREPSWRDHRDPIRLVVEYEDADDLVGDYTENLSLGGTFVVTSRELTIGTRVHLVLSFPGLLERIAIPGIVRWTRAHSGEDAGAGIEFEAGPGRDQLAAVIERIQARHPKTVVRALELLVVDDNRHIAELIQDGLLGSMRRDTAGPSFAIRSACDGRAALDLLHRGPCDVLIIDVYLPLVNGPRVITHARTELGLTDMAIIAFSAGGDAARDAALEAGANVFLDKPIRLRQVLETIQRLVAS